MKRYVKLVNFEFNRIAKVYAVLLGIILTSQIIGVMITANGYLKKADKAMNEDMMSKAEFLQMYGQMDFHNIAYSIWFIGPIALSVAAVAFYIFLIWYRDWFGKNTFAYRLLTLPTARLNVFFAKLTTIVLMTFGFIAFQFIIYPIESTVMKWMVPKDFRIDLTFHELTQQMLDLGLLYPTEPMLFLLHYGIGIIAVTILFTVILFERSFRWKGIIFGVIYSAVAGIVIFLPLILQEFLLNGYFYPSELIRLSMLAGVIVLAGSIALSGYLLNKKIRI
ncbi:hypothetical protein [Lentibacillus saliphilus]|uniref:hypothetical protein n=1 Tax=Lentibacillus saliphilus TaxID=2737028 RepID=UPI001C2F4FEE|nr:hypothetical protein [Lentibacillus saliphilus]